MGAHTIKNLHKTAVVPAIMSPIIGTIGYGLSIYFGFTDPVITYISDTVTEQPLSGLFGLALFFITLTIGLITYTRHMYVQEICEMYPEINTSRLNRLNKASGWLIFVAVVSMPIVALFPMSTALYVHAVTALLSITCGLLYTILQVVCTKAMVPKFTSSRIYNLRVLIATGYFTFYAIGVIAGIVSLSEFDGEHLHIWSPETGGYVAHAVSSVCEWIILFCYATYFATFAHEFKHISINYKLVIPVKPNRMLQTTSEEMK